MRRFVILFLLVALWPAELIAQPSAEAVRLRHEILSYLDGRAKTQWFLDGLHADPNPSQLLAMTKQASSMINHVLVSYSSIPEVKRLRERFSGRIDIAFMDPSGTPMLVMTKEQLERLSDASRIVVELYGENDQLKARTRQLLIHYDQRARTVVMGGAFMSREWQAAVLLYALDIARRHRDESVDFEGAPSEQLMREVTQAHLLEQRVLDMSTGGRYGEQLRAIARKYGDAKDISEVILSVRADDMRSLDMVFGAASDREARLRPGIYLLNIGNTWLELRFQGEELARQRVNNFRIYNEIARLLLL